MGVRRARLRLPFVPCSCRLCSQQPCFGGVCGSVLPSTGPAAHGLLVTGCRFLKIPFLYRLVLVMVVLAGSVSSQQLRFRFPAWYVWLIVSACYACMAWGVRCLEELVGSGPLSPCSRVLRPPSTWSARSGWLPLTGLPRFRTSLSSLHLWHHRSFRHQPPSSSTNDEFKCG